MQEQPECDEDEIEQIQIQRLTDCADLCEIIDDVHHHSRAENNSDQPAIVDPVGGGRLFDAAVRLGLRVRRLHGPIRVGILEEAGRNLINTGRIFFIGRKEVESDRDRDQHENGEPERVHREHGLREWDNADSVHERVVIGRGQETSAGRWTDMPDDLARVAGRAQQRVVERLATLVAGTSNENGENGTDDEADTPVEVSTEHADDTGGCRCLLVGIRPRCNPAEIVAHQVRIGDRISCHQNEYHLHCEC